MSCRWDRDAEDYLAEDGQPCRTDEYGDPTRHCTAKRRCAHHVGPHELTCAGCIGAARSDLRSITAMSALLMTAAINDGVDSESANLAGPAADPEAWTWRKIAARQGKAWHVSLIEDDDERHPYTVLTRWQMMLAEDWGHDLPERLTITGAAAYLERQLPRLAQDPEQDFALFAREIRKVRSHLESVLHNDRRPDRGVPCPECTSPETGVGPRLVREYGHWCLDAECCRIHAADDSLDRWVCPRNRAHAWDIEAYERWIAERRAG